MLKIQKNIPLKKHTTFKIGGNAGYFLDARDRGSIIDGILWAKSRRIPFMLIGGGSNILFGEKGYKGLIIRNSWRELRKINKDTVFASSGLEMPALVEYFAKNGMGGMEWAGGLPGTLGGAVRGNAGAFMGEIKDSVHGVESFSENKGIIERGNKKCGFGYRDSIFKHNGEIILGVLLKYRKADRKKIRAKISECKKYRQAHQPLSYPSAGSFFKNIPLKEVSARAREEFKDVIKVDPFPVIPAAAVTDKLGLKGKQIGGARLSKKHPNFIVNTNRASCSDVIALANLVKRKALKKYDIKMTVEVQIIQ